MLNGVSNMLMNFLSNKINLILILCGSYVMLGCMLYMNNIPLSQQVLMLIILFVISFVVHTMGISKGILLATINRRKLDKMVELIEEQEQNGETPDFNKINRIIEDDKKKDN